MRKPTKKLKNSNSSKKETHEPKSMYRLQLGKTATEFFSERGNSRLKRIWLANNLDEEMIFSSWIGPSKSLVRQRVSDYIQAFVIRRSTLSPFPNTDMIAKLRRFSIHFDFHRDGERNHHDMYFQSCLLAKYKNHQESREEDEKRRIARSIANGELQAIPGYEYVVEDPVFKVQEMEKQMLLLAKIPLPYNEVEFTEHILPMMTALAVSNEQRKTEAIALRKRIRSKCFGSHGGCGPKTSSSSSGFSDDSEATIENESGMRSDSELIQVLSEIDLNSDEFESKIDLDETLRDFCEVCGGFLKSESEDDEHEGLLTCSCIPDPVWEGRKHSSASSLYKEASKIVDLYIRERLVSAEYMERFAFKTWLK